MSDWDRLSGARRDRAGDGLLADLLDGGILVVTPGSQAAAESDTFAGVATLLQPDGDVVTLLAHPGTGTIAPGELASHAQAVRRTTADVRRAARRLRRRARLLRAAVVLSGLGGMAGTAVASGRVPSALDGLWLAGAAALAAIVGGTGGVMWLWALTGFRQRHGRRTAAANRAWLADHGFQTGSHDLSSPV